MEKREIKINYDGSGVKTLKTFGNTFFIVAVIALVVAVIGLFVYLGSDGYESMAGISVAASFLPIAMGSFAGAAICLGLSTVAKTALYKRTLLEEQYNFTEGIPATEEERSFLEQNLVAEED